MGRISTWTNNEVKYLKENWNSSTAREIAETLGKSKQSCYDKAFSLGLKKRKSYNSSSKVKVLSSRGSAGAKNILASKWTVSQVNFLKENIGSLSIKEISEKIGKSVPAVYCKARSLKKVKNLRPAPDTPETIIESNSSSNHYKAWSKKDEAILKSKFNKSSIEDLASELGRTPDAIKGRAYALGLIIESNESSNRTRWTESEVKYLKSNIKSKSFEEIGEHLGRSAAAVATKASSLKISKPSPMRQRKSSKGSSSSKISAQSIALTISLAINTFLAGYLIILFLN